MVKVSKWLNVTIDGVQIKVPEGTTVLLAARQAGLHIPTLCYHPKLSPTGACRMCTVEVEGMKGFHTSCTLPCSDGMVVHTSTPAVKSMRQHVLWLLLSDYPCTECLLCDKRNTCNLRSCEYDIPVEQRCCYKWEACELRFIVDDVGLPEGLPKPKYAHRGFKPAEDEPLILIDRNKCILCERCIKACQEARGIGAIGFIFRGRNSFTGPPPGMSLEDSGCKFCCTCVEVCPSGALLDKVSFDDKPREQVLVPCKYACPAGIDVPRYIRLIAEGKFEEALSVNRERVPFPKVLGRVCMHPCEDACRRQELNKPIAIRLLKRFVADYAKPTWKERSTFKPKKEKRIAVIGAGPAGLTAAYYLRKLGYSITVFDENDEPGGMMRYGIPHYRLPKEVLDEEVNEILSLGIELRTRAKVESIEWLFAQGFSSIFIAIGTQKAIKLGIDGEEHYRVIDGLTLLKRVNMGEQVSLGESVGVIGGGNVAIDASRVALRLGADNVTILYRRTRDEMPALDEEIEAALEEGVRIEPLVAPKRIIGNDDSVNIELIRMRLGAPDETGRPRPIPIEGSEFMLRFDSLIVAIGQAPEIPKGFGVELTRRGLIAVDDKTLATSIEGVFAGGDIVLGPSSVIEAIAHGRLAASSIDKFLGGDGDIDERLTDEGFIEKRSLWMGRVDGFAYLNRVKPAMLHPDVRRENFDEVELGFTPEEAIAEAARCLQCDMRFQMTPMPIRKLEAALRSSQRQ
ncbi:MAG: FAD-dependent oxidoreductase [Armatimonadota bacterium]|nr:FAD-dependent oxidoreductase [Armatimonadota bacterium]MCX7777073.1 FAD-dependent oxidoreductase [Armatimonadota bacterium]MDW8024857.1 FAD-dependent oxidoreductase [Armatimonadota bacterium]